MLSRFSISLLVVLAGGLFCTNTVQSQETTDPEKRLYLETRPVRKGRIDVNDRVWRAKYRLDDAVVRGRSHEKILQEEAEAFGWSRGLEDLELIQDRRLSSSRHITYQQRFKGLPVEGRFVRVNLDVNDQPAMILSGYAPLKSDPSFSTTPVVSSTEAESIARGKISDPDAVVQSPTLVIFPEEIPVLAWRVIVWPTTHPAEYVVLIDAKSGAVISYRDQSLSENRLNRGNAGFDGLTSAPSIPTASQPPVVKKNVRVDGSGYVFDPDPITKVGVSYGPPYADNDDAANAELNAARVLVNLLDISTDSQGQYVLEGPHIRIVGTNQSGSTTYSPPTAAAPDGFAFTRDNDGFEAVNAYYHIDQSQRYVQSFGINNRQNSPIEANPLGLSNDDSFYFPNRNLIIFGSGGVDDAEDASVIWHEYAHALLQSAAPGLLSSLEGTALHEGWADYWAASYARHLWEIGAVARSDWERVFRWDSGDGQIWNGRVLNHAGHYPEDTCSDDPSPVNCSPHNDGRLWGTVLMEIYSDLGREVTDELNLRSHTYLIVPTTFRDAAEAMVQADLDYFGGAHLTSLLNRFGARGLVDTGSFGPTVFHDELPWNENLGGSVTISAQARGVSSPVAQVVMKFRVTGGEEMTLLLQPQSGDVYEAELNLPSSPSVISYYLEVTDTGSRKGFVPASAPVDMFSFGVGPDTEPPSLSHTPVSDFPLVSWPPDITVNATDNLGVDHVSVDFRIETLSGTPVIDGAFLLVRDGDAYSGPFPVDAGTLPPNVTVYYSIEGVDASVSSNSTRLPGSGEYAFQVTSEGILRSFDFEVPSSTILTNGVWERGKPTFGILTAFSGANVMATSLSSAYPATVGLSVLELPKVNLTDVSNALLTFWHWFDTEHDGSADPSASSGGLWDGGNLEVSINGGIVWRALTPENGYNGIIAQANANPLRFQPAFGGYSYGWRQVIAPLPAASDVRIRFNFGTDNDNSDVSRSFAGWYVDDIRITTVRPSDGESPTATMLPPESVVSSVEFPQPLIEATLLDDNGVADVIIDYTYHRSGGEASGSIRMELDPATTARYFRVLEFISDPIPSDRITYQIRVSDFSGNESLFPSVTETFSIEYELIQNRDVTMEASVSGIWVQFESGWSSLGPQDPFSFVSSINFVPINLPLNSTTLQFSMFHDYQLAPDFGGNVKITDDGGRTWVLLDPVGGYPDQFNLDSLHPMRGEPGFAGTSSESMVSVFELNQYGGKQVRIRVDLATPRAASIDEGWRIGFAEIRFATDEIVFDVSRTFELHSVYPNPFDRSTQIGFTLEKTGPIELSVFDILGRRIGMIADGVFEAGSYERTLSANGLSAGIYVVRLIAGGRQVSRTIVVVD
ncbi:MAG: T9SS type A sorting domain-containing protein [Bacteroidetes bacterium]|nr:T9SS type A sorting domain-containing protein [Bacteroidota bacterium]